MMCHGVKCAQMVECLPNFSHIISNFCIKISNFEINFWELVAMRFQSMNNPLARRLTRKILFNHSLTSQLWLYKISECEPWREQPLGTRTDKKILFLTSQLWLCFIPKIFRTFRKMCHAHKIFSTVNIREPLRDEVYRVFFALKAHCKIIKTAIAKKKRSDIVYITNKSEPLPLRSVFCCNFYAVDHNYGSV